MMLRVLVVMANKMLDPGSTRGRTEDESQHISKTKEAGADFRFVQVYKATTRKDNGYRAFVLCMVYTKLHVLWRYLYLSYNPSPRR